MDQRSSSLGRVDAININDDEIEENEVEVTRAQIEQTRSGMSETIEAIKDKLNPQVLMSQAKDTVTDMAGTLAQRAKETVHDVASDVLDQAKTNLPEMTSNLAHQAVHGAVNEAKEAMGSAVHSATEAVGGAVDTARDAGSSVIEMIQRNPLPAALIVTGLGWFWMKNRHDGAERQRLRDYRYRPEYSPQSNMAPRYENQRGNASSPPQSGQPGVVDSARQAVGDAVDTAREAVGHAAHSASEAVGGAMDTARGAGSSVVEVIERNPLPVALLATSVGWLWMNQRSSGRRDTNDYLRRYNDPWRQYDAPSPSGAAATVAASAAQAVRGAQDRVGEVAGQIQDKAGEFVDQTQDRLGRLGSVAAQQVEQTTDLLQRTLHENPMAAGAVALGLGAALGLLVPETRQENQWMGEARDRMVHKAKETVQDVGLKAQIVAEEAIGAAKQEAKVQGLAPEQGHTP